MTPHQAHDLLTLVATAHDRTVPTGLGDIWAATLTDISFELGRTAVIEILKTSPHLPKVADVREKARLISNTRDRALAVKKQLEDRAHAPGPNARAFTGIYRHVNQRLADAGQNVKEAERIGFADPRAKEHLLGPQRCADIAETACTEWLDTHPQQ